MRTKTAKATKTNADVVHPSHLNGSTLPLDWERVSLGNICRTTSGGTPSRKNKEYFEGDIPWVKSGELPDGPVFEIEEYITGEAVKNSSAKQFPKGTLLIALYGATVGKLGVLTQEAATNQAVCAIFPPDDLETKYLFWYLRFVRSDLIAQAIGGAQPNISQGILRNLLIPIAPPNEQKSIVAEIEKQFSRLDEAVANLKRVRANLKRYRAAVFKAAVEGKLTEDWRKQHPNVEPATKLLERILAERPEKWSGKGKHKEPSQFLEGDCPDLPANWAWASLDSIANVIDPNPSHRMPKYVDNGTPFISSENFIGSDDIDFTIGKTVPGKVLQEQKARFAIREGDFVLTRIGTIGKTRFLPPSQTYCLSHALVIIQGLTSDIDRRYLRYVVASDATIEQAKLGVQSVGVPDLGMAKIRAFRIPLTCEAEQKEIVAEVERRLSVIEELEAAVQANLTRADRLRQSILQRAFTGKLALFGPQHLKLSFGGTQKAFNE